MKTCKLCNISQPADKFHGRVCRPCLNARGRKYYQQLDPETKRTLYGLYAASPVGKAKKKRYYAKVKKDILQHYCKGNIACNCCGESKEQFLTLDHIEPFSLTKAGPRGGRTLYQWLRKRNYPEGFQVLCYNCNMARAKYDGVCPHKL